VRRGVRRAQTVFHDAELMGSEPNPGANNSALNVNELTFGTRTKRDIVTPGADRASMLARGKRGDDATRGHHCLSSLAYVRVHHHSILVDWQPNVVVLVSRLVHSNPLVYLDTFIRDLGPFTYRFLSLGDPH
jgi:hypothetical protein